MIYDDFNDNDLDLAKWMVFENDSPGSVVEVNSRVEISSGVQLAIRSSITSTSRVLPSAGNIISANVVNNVDPQINPFTVAEFGCYRPTDAVGTYQGIEGTGPAIIVGGMFGFRVNVGGGYFTPSVVPAFVVGQSYFIEIEFASSSQVYIRVDGVTLYSGAYVYNPDYAIYCMMDSLGAIPDPISVYFDDVFIPDFVIPLSPLIPINERLNIRRDLKIIHNGSHFDISQQDQDLATDHWLIPALYVSLFTDRRAAIDDIIPDGGNDRRGWWSNPDLGSRLWLLSRSKQVQQTLVDARHYVIESLQWIMDINDNNAVDVTVNWGGSNWMIISITVFLQDEPAFNQLFNYYLEG